MMTSIRIRMRVLFCATGICVQFLGSLGASPVERASQPLPDGVPEVAVLRLEELAAGGLSGADRTEVLLRLGEAYSASSQPEKALTVLGDASLQESEEAAFWRAQSLAQLERWPDALKAFGEVAARANSPRQQRARFGLAEANRALGEDESALSLYRTLFVDPDLGTRARFCAVELLLKKQEVAEAGQVLEAAQPRSASERKARRYWRGRVAALGGRAARANSSFRAILARPEGASHEMLVAALFALTDAHLKTNAPAEAADVLEGYVEQRPTDPALAKIFAKLEACYQLTKKPWRNEFGRWSRDPAQPRRAYAQWYLARADLRAERKAEAARGLAQLQVEGVRAPGLAPAYLESARLQIDAGEFPGALATLKAAEELSPPGEIADEIAWLAAATNYRGGKFTEGIEKFSRIAASHPEWRIPAQFNAALGWLQAGDEARFSESYQRIANQPAQDGVAGELLLERGLSLASQNDPKAGDYLRNFLQQNPASARAGEAWIALAEMAFHRAPPALEEARQHLAQAAPGASGAVRERADYLRLWIEGSAGDDSRIIELATNFLQQNTRSPLLPEVRLKLAEAYFRKQDFSNAQTHFETLARTHPDHVLAEKALYFAAQSAKSTMGPEAFDRAMTLFDEVAKKKAELQWAARNEQALLERKLGKNKEALLVYAEVLAQSSKASDKREALCGTGDIYFELGGTEPANFRRAVEYYDRLAEDTQSGSHWRHQALFKKAICQQKLGEQENALATFYQVLEDPVRPEASRETFWFYKAGFDAAQLLESMGKWKSAAAIYEKLGRAGGARSAEAEARLTKLRLEQFLWE